MRRRLTYAVLAAAALCAMYGFVDQRLFAQAIWLPEGLARFAVYTAIYWAVAVVFLPARPAWFVPCVAAFVFVYSTWWCSLHFHPLAPLAVLYFLGSCWLLGRFLARDAILALIAGLAIWIFAISIAVHFAVNYPAVYAIAFAIPYLAALRWRVKITWTWPRPSFSLALLMYLLLAYWLIALKPEVSSDGLAMHLAIPSMIAHDHRFAFDFERYTWALMPMGGDFAFTGVYLLGGEAAARLLNFALMVVLVAVVYRASRRWLSDSGASIASALFASTPLVELVSGSLFVENVWAVMIAGAAVALSEGELAISGLLLGAAFSTKIGTSAYLLPAAVIGFMKLKRRWRAAAGAFALFTILAAPPYFYAWLRTGNPMFPFENQVFHSPHFERTNTFEGPRQAVAWTAPYDATFRSSEHIEGQDGAFGFQYFLLTPALLLLWNRRAPGALVAFALAGSVLSFVSLPNIRYLYPALPLISIGFAWLISEIPVLLVAAVALIGLNIYFLPASGWYDKDFALFTRAQWDQYMKDYGPQRELIAVLNRTAPGEPAALLGGDAIAGLDARAYTDTWHTYTFWRRLIESHNPAQIAAMFRELGIRHVITPYPPHGRYAVVDQFVNRWTVPSGASCGTFELRNLLAAPLAPPRDTSPAGAGMHDDVDRKIQYTGAWLHDAQFKAALNHSITYSNTPGDSLSFFFSGAEITYIYTKALNRGIAEVSIDRKVRAEIDLYSKQTEWRQRTVFRDLELGPHTIEVRVTGAKNPRSTGYFVDLDAFSVR